jgi:hypothetical protein
LGDLSVGRFSSVHERSHFTTQAALTARTPTR